MDNYVIDRSRLSEEDNAKFDEIIAKAMVDPKAAQEEMEDQEPPVTPPKKKPAEKAEVEEMPETKKSAPEVPQFVLNAIAKSNEFIEAQEKKDMLDVAKKYAPLVEDVDVLAKQLGDLKKQSPELYATSISMMDNQLAMITRPDGLFGEIGKSAGGHNTGGDAKAKAEAKAREIMKADPNITHTEAIAKAWEDPDLMAECDAEYFGWK